MEKGLKFYKEGKPIYEWESQYDEKGNVKHGGEENKYKIIKARVKISPFE